MKKSLIFIIIMCFSLALGSTDDEIYVLQNTIKSLETRVQKLESIIFKKDTNTNQIKAKTNNAWRSLTVGMSKNDVENLLGTGSHK